MSGDDAGRLRAFWWQDNALAYVDQRFLPQQLIVATVTDVDGVVAAIKNAGVVGPRCVDLFGAFGVALAYRLSSEPERAAAVSRIRRAARYAGASAAIDRVAGVPSAALAEAYVVQSEELRIDRAISEHASALLPADGRVLTLGHTGALATGGAGTALGAILTAVQAGRAIEVWQSAGRPASGAARLSHFELRHARVPAVLFADGAAAWVIENANITAVLLGAVALAANGDVVGEIGTYAIAVAAARHGVPFYVATPRAAINMSQRHAGRPALHVRAELDGVRRADPLVDVTPGHLVTAIVTEYGLTRAPYREALADLATRPNFTFTTSLQQPR